MTLRNDRYSTIDGYPCNCLSESFDLDGKLVSADDIP